MFFLSMAADGFLGEWTFDATLFSPKEGGPNSHWTNSLQFYGVGNVAYGLPLKMKIDLTGTYWVEIRHGDAMVTRSPLEVQYQQMPDSN